MNERTRRLKAVDRLVGRRQSEFVGLLLDLVSIPTINPAYDNGGNEEPGQRRLAYGLRQWGIESELWTPTAADLAPFIATEIAARKENWDGRPNLVASVGEAATGRTLLLNGHMDVVGVTEEEVWTSDPFHAEVRQGRAYGRGAVDDKGPLCALACALAIIRELGVSLPGQAVLTSVVDEEQGGGGTLAAISRGLICDAGIVAESTSLVVAAANRSNRRMRLTVSGLSAHSGEAFRGVNAILKAIAYIEALFGLAEELDRRRPAPLWSHLPVQHVFNLNGIDGGRIGKPGAVADRCVFDMHIGGTIAESRDEIEAEAEAVINQVTKADPWLREHPPSLEWMPMRMDAVMTDPTHPFVEMCHRTVAEVTGRRSEVAALSAATDMRHLVKYARMPCITFGPGIAGASHSGDEWLPVDEYVEAIRCYSAIILDWCG